VNPWPTYPDLAGKVAVVTGGSGGIGATSCAALAANGVKVVVSGRDSEALEAVLQDIRRSGGEASAHPADCTRETELQALRAHAEQVFGPADIVLAFAGGGIARPQPVQEVPEPEWRAVVDGNLTATYLTLRSFLPRMLERHSGAIVTMASTAARLPSKGPAPYAAAKAGVIMLTRHLAAEAGPHGVRVNCLAPSAILTARNLRLIDEVQRRQIAAMHPLGRLGTPEDVALAALFLASASAAWLTGLVLDVAGGRVMA
jgi:3-oxoacyl-[acyl-carrier protein] reductase